MNTAVFGVPSSASSQASGSGSPTSAFNLTARIAEALREGWLGEAEGLKVSLAAAEAKLAQVDGLIARRRNAVSLGMPSFPDIAGHTSAPAKEPTMTSPATLAAGLRAHAQGLCCLAAAAEFLIAQSWLHRDDFTSRFVTVHPSIGSGQQAAVIDWPAVITALGSSFPAPEASSGC